MRIVRRLLRSPIQERAIEVGVQLRLQFTSDPRLVFRLDSFVQLLAPISRRAESTLEQRDGKRGLVANSNEFLGMHPAPFNLMPSHRCELRHLLPHGWGITAASGQRLRARLHAGLCAASVVG